LKTGNHISIRAPYDRVFELGANVEDWARILPHYRYVRVLARNGAHKTVQMSAMRDFIPVTWSAVETVVEGSAQEPGRIEFRHIKGLVSGMYVEWSFKVEGDRVLVTISHDLERTPFPIRLLGAKLTDIIVGKGFIGYIANKTLRRVKQLAEAENVGRTSDG
jgi:ribosome-associated toxin RatA of RatAB toxin-antitoxin module